MFAVLISRLVCSIAGSKSGFATVSGADYLDTFGYSKSHIWRNFGVIIAFAVFYIVVAMIGLEYMNFGAGGGSIKLLTKKPEPVPEELPIIEEPQRVKSEDPEKDRGPEARELALMRKVTTIKASGSVFTWTNVNYSIGDIQLLHNINGYCKPGRLTALMGPSGAGKTTLLDNLGLRKRVGVTTGELRMDGKPLMPDFGRSTAFVEQQDVHDGMVPSPGSYGEKLTPSLAMSTVREAMQFSAMLRQPPNVPVEDKYKYVEDIIKLLELEPLADAMIGFPGFGLSVGERKRVTIAIELAAAPSELLFLDEPT